MHDPGVGYIYVATVNNKKHFLEGFSVQIATQFQQEPKTDPLSQCLTDVNLLIANLDTSRIDKAEKLLKNLVHSKDNFTSNATLVINQFNSTNPPTIGSVKVYKVFLVYLVIGFQLLHLVIQVLYNYTDEHKTPIETERKLKELQLTAKSLSSELPNLFHQNSSSFSVRFKLKNTRLIY